MLEAGVGNHVTMHHVYACVYKVLVMTCVPKFWLFLIFINNKKLSSSIYTSELTHLFPHKRNFILVALNNMNNTEFMLNFKGKFTSNLRLMSLIWTSGKCLHRKTLTSPWKLCLPSPPHLNGKKLKCSLYLLDITYVR